VGYLQKALNAPMGGESSPRPPFTSLWMVYQPFTSLLPAFYQPLAGWLVG